MVTRILTLCQPLVEVSSVVPNSVNTSSGGQGPFTLGPTRESPVNIWNRVSESGDLTTSS